MTGCCVRVYDIGTRAESNLGGCDIGLAPRYGELDAGWLDDDVADEEFGRFGDRVTGIFTDTEETIESKEEGAPVTGIRIGSEVEEREDSGDVGKCDRMCGSDMIELTVDVFQTLPGPPKEDSFGEGTERTGIMPELECREVGREGFDRPSTAEPYHR